MGYWKKYFADNTELVGTDRDVARGLATWSRSRLSDMVAAETVYEDKILRIQGPGEYWQSDGYEAIFPGPGSRMTRRRIERRIEPDDGFFFYTSDSHKTVVAFTNLAGVLYPLGQPIPIPLRWCGTWMILEYDIKLGKTHYYTRSTRL